MNILAIDTSNQALGLAIMKNNELVAELMTNTKKDHSTRLMPAIVSMMENVDLTPEQLDKIVVARGPGSYTGTRIGVTVAKTMAWALEVPIYTISSLATLAYNGRFFDGYICPLFDARRQTVFTGLYQFHHGTLQEVEKDHNVSLDSWLEKLLTFNKRVMFISPHMKQLEQPILSILQNQAVIPEGQFHLPRASSLISLSEQSENIPVHIVQPNYLRITEAEANLRKRIKDNE